MPQRYNVSREFVELPDGSLPSFIENVVDKMTGNVKFPTPLVPLADLTTAEINFSSALAASLNGGPEATAVKNETREIAENLLHKQADYVQSLTSTNLADLLSSGFEAASKNRTQIELAKPVILRVENPQTTQLALRVPPVPTSRALEVRIKFGTNDWQAAGIFTSSRRMRLTNLTPGTVYTIQVRAIGGSTGYSDWSDPVSHMAT